MIGNIEFSVSHQLERLKAKYKKEIKAIGAVRNKRDEFHKLLVELSEAGRHLQGTSHLLPFYYILTNDYHMAWVLLNCLNIRFGLAIRYNPDNKDYHEYTKRELENPVDWD